MAWIIQKPSKKTSVALVISGREGAGKGIVVQKLSEVIGKHAKQTSNMEDVIKFNEYMCCDTTLLFLDEALWAGDKSARGKLYSLISEEKTVYEKKHGIKWIGPNRINMIIASNHEWVVPVDGQGRRFFVMQASDERAFSFDKDKMASNTAYWDRVVNVPVEAFAVFLWTRDIRGFNPRHVPLTKHLAHQQAASLDPIMQWLIHCIENRKILTEEEGSWKRVALSKVEPALLEASDFGGCWMQGTAMIESFRSLTGQARRVVTVRTFLTSLNRILQSRVNLARINTPAVGLFMKLPSVGDTKQLVATYLGRADYDFDVGEESEDMDVT